MRWYFMVLRKYAVFAGRARRKEWWIFALVHLAIILSLRGADILMRAYDRSTRLGLMSGLYELAVLIPVIAVSVRRLHDTNRSGWWYFIIFIPLAGIIKLLMIMAEDSQPGANRYGPNPKIDWTSDTTAEAGDLT
jgi:uncharacterized membrane protein YhaH (DUF805 family)